MSLPSLRQEPRYEPAAVIPLKKDSSLLDWLEATGRLIKREPVEVIPPPAAADEELELENFIDTDDSFYDEEDDSIDLELDED
jgi:hypothetical protein